ncbi:MAG: outer membrane beta-barrel protein [Hymenobacteraceae bacterium]|nr:outer membrane beta-barrel protein [Hymenobacteraceae bacterium]
MLTRLPVFGALFFLFVGLTLGAYAQQIPSRVTGRALDATTGEPLIGATIQLISTRDTTVRSGGVADVTGNFTVSAARGGDNILSVSFLGYQTVRRALTLPLFNGVVEIGSVGVAAAAVRLGTAEVVGRTPPVVQKGDTAQYNANAFKTNPDADARDLLTKLPGVGVGTDGKVQVQGEAVQRVLVDGKQFFGDDPDAVLRNVPAEAIDKIQVFDRQSEQSQFSGFDDGNTTKTINIVTKPQFRSGQFGRVVVGGGPERYRASASVNSFDGDRRVSVVAQSNNVNEQNFSTDDLLGVISSAQAQAGGAGGRGGARGGGGGSAGNFLVSQRGGITTTHAAGVNFTDKLGARTDAQGSYFFNHTENDARADLARQYVLPQAAGQRYTEASVRTSRNQNHRLSMRLDHKLDSANSLLFTPRATLQLNRAANTLTGQTFRGDSLGSTTGSRYNSDLTAGNLSGELLFRHRFARQGRTLSLSATPSYNARAGPSTLQADTRAGQTEVLPRYALNQRADLDQAGWSLGTNLSYTEPLTTKTQLQGTYTFSYAPNSSDKQTFDLDTLTGQYGRRNEPLSNVFTNQYTTHGAGLTYRYNDRKLQASAGLTGQRAQLSGEQTFPRAADVDRVFYRLLPNAQARVRFSRDKNLRLNYSARTNAPGIGQLQEVVNNANPLQLTTGNPDLRQETQHNMFVRYSAAKPDAGTSFFALLSGSATRDNITNQTTVAVRETFISPTLTLPAGAQLTRPVNLNGYYSARAFSSYGLPLKGVKSTLNHNVSATYARTPGLVNGKLNYARTPAVSGGLTLSSNISEKLDFALTSNTAYTRVTNTLRTTADNAYLNHTSSLRLSWLVGPGISVKTDVSHQLYSGLTAGFDQNYVLWNASVGKKIFANQRGEIQLYVYDILKQNQAIQRTITEAYLEDQRTTVLQRYAMLVFTYNIRRGTGGVPKVDLDRGPDGEQRPKFGPGGRPPGFGPPPGQ